MAHSLDPHEGYRSPYSARYASAEMEALFSDHYKFKSWRRMWIALAKVEKDLGLAITEEQIAEMEAHLDDIDYELAQAKEKEIRHDVMSHVYAYGKVCPKAHPIIHLGATSCFVTDNAELLQMQAASLLVQKKAAQVVANLARFADQYKDLPTLGYTHLQPAQMTTVGKRACLWIQDLALAMHFLQHCLDDLRLRGAKGTTGTQASFLALFDGDEEKVKALDRGVAQALGFSAVYPVTGQTYPRQVDFHFLAAMSNFAQAASKFGNDLRLLQSFEEMEEPFETSQVGSSAMPYKRNPMRSERICSLARQVMINALNPAITASCQWFERTLDDSANRRLALSEAFLGVDAILNIYINITQSLTVYDKVIARRVMEKLPYMATENVMMASVKRGKDRQEIHERIRQHAHAAVRLVKLAGLENDLIARLAADEEIPLNEAEIRENLDPQAYVGRAPQQVSDYLKEEVVPLLARYHQEEQREELTI